MEQFLVVIQLIVTVQKDKTEPLLVHGAFLLCVDPFVEEWPGVNRKGFLLIHAAVKQPQQSFCHAQPFEH